MIAIAKKTQVRARGWRRRYLRLLPSIRRQAEHAFRRMYDEQREEAVADVVANTFAAYRRLVQLGKEDVAYATALTRFAVSQYRSGRRVGSSLNCRDVLSPTRLKSNEVVSLEALYGDQTSLANALIDQRQTPIPEQAAFRIDFGEWLRRLRPRDRRLASSSRSATRRRKPRQNSTSAAAESVSFATSCLGPGPRFMVRPHLSAATFNLPNLSSRSSTKWIR